MNYNQHCNRFIIRTNDYAVSPTNWGIITAKLSYDSLLGRINIMQCPNCHHWNEAGSRFCEECGLELPKDGATGNQVSVRATSVQPAAADAPDAVDFSEFVDA